ncbi:hypothetical protein [uncultured Psychrobacter sp.]|uniref:hypothetical protein n=1 Tax=uncultured Psychrobacter sp. TaxID=259303 RepID=UPI002595C1FF|nr:hypothetical protein [uncultured Psychrobacter sp.]
MALTDKINDGFAALTNLVKGKVDKTAVIAVAQGGTGGTDTATARGNLGLGTAATANVTTSKQDDTNGRLLKVGDFGLGSNNTENSTLDLKNYLKNGFVAINGSANSPVTYGLGFQLNGADQWQAYLIFDITSDNIYTSFRPNPYSNLNFAKILTTLTALTIDINFKSVASGSASYKKGWRKLTATLPSASGEITVAHGVTTVETVQAKVTNTDGIIVYNNDIDSANQFYVRVNGANLVLGVTANSTKVFGQPVTIYVGEEL